MIRKIFSNGVHTQRGNRKQEQKIKLEGKKIYTTQQNYHISKQMKHNDYKARVRASKNKNKNLKHPSTSLSNKRMKVLTVRKKDASTGSC